MTDGGVSFPSTVAAPADPLNRLHSAAGQLWEDLLFLVVHQSLQVHSYLFLLLCEQDYSSLPYPMIRPPGDLRLNPDSPNYQSSDSGQTAGPR